MESSLRELRDSNDFQTIVRALAALCRNEFHDGDRRNIKKWLEKRWKKREGEVGGISRVIVSVEMNFSFRAKVAKRFVT